MPKAGPFLVNTAFSAGDPFDGLVTVFFWGGEVLTVGASRSKRPVAIEACTATN